MTKITVSPRLLSVVGRNLYEGNPVFILCRELIQNSRDAQLANRSDKPIHLSLNRGEDVTVSCEDTGIGMNKDILENVFLSLGDTYNPTGIENKTGGFGIAKAAIFASSFWTIHTTNCYLDFDMLENGLDTKDVSSICGTIVTARFDKMHLFSWDIDKIVAMLEFSEVKTNFILDKTELKESHGYILKNYTGKLLGEKGFNDDKTNVKVLLYPVIIKSYDESRTAAYKGYDIYRINGLVQFLNSTYSNRQTNVIIDVSTTILPGDDNYPYSLSRESVKDEITSFVNSLLREQNENVLSSARIANSTSGDEFEKDYIHPIPYGKSIKESNDTLPDDSDMPDWLKDVCDNENDELKNTHVNALKPDKYERVIMRMYAYILESLQDKPFYIGITREEDIVGYNGKLSNGEKVYGINPHVFDHIKDKSALIYAVWALVCHELAHNNSKTHNESFTSEEGLLSRTTPMELIKITSYITRTILKRL